MDESGQEQRAWTIKSANDITASPGTSAWMKQMAELDKYYAWLKATKKPKIHENVGLAQADKEALSRKVKAGMQFSTNPNNQKNKSTPLSTAGRYGEYTESQKALDDWPR